MSTELLAPSWDTDEQLEELARIRRNEEITSGIITQLKVISRTKKENGKTVKEDVEVLAIKVNGRMDLTVYCPQDEFSEHDFKSLTGFVGTVREFIITNIDLDERVAVASVKAADQYKQEHFWRELVDYQEAKELSDHIFTGTISGINPQNQTIFVRVNGLDCFMNRNDWDHGRVYDLESQVERGSEVQVKVLRFDKERNLVQVSRRAAVDDPFDYLEELKNTEAIVGKISTVHPIHGIFVELDNGLEVKGMKPRQLEEPVVGDIVTCRIRHIDREKRHCRVVIIGYPQGKKQVKDFGDFIFS